MVRVVFAASTLGGMLVAIGCSDGVFGCADDSQCLREGLEGVCQGSGYCSFPDANCTSGQRYGAHAGDGLAMSCVQATTTTTNAGPLATTGSADSTGTGSGPESASDFGSATATPSTGDGAGWATSGAATGLSTSTSGSTSTTNAPTTTAVAGSTSGTGSNACPCSIWDDATSPTVEATTDTLPVELGLRFRSQTNGFITAIRFYKGVGNDGPHTVSLWTNTGELLEQTTAQQETTSGWQEVALPQPVSVNGNVTYVASYSAPFGRYAFDNEYFAASGFDSPPLRALQDGVDGINGVFRYGIGFPTDGFESANYWVDVVFVESVP